MKKFVCTVCGYVHEETLHRLNVQSVMHQLINSKSRQEKDLGLQSTL